MVDLGDGITTMVEFQPPDYEDKEELLKYMLHSAQSLGNIQDAALLVAAAINQIHPFRDGNGTLSRYLYAQLSAGGDFFKQHKEEIINSRDSIDIGSYIPNKYLEKVARERLGDNATSREIAAEAVKVLCDSFTDDNRLLFPDDIPLSAFRPAAQNGISLVNYLRMASNNLVTSNLRPKTTWELNQETKMRERKVVGYDKDRRFGNNS